MSKILIQPPENGEGIFGVKYDIEKGLDPRFMALRKTPKILHPCRFIYPYIDNLQWGHPSSVPDQLQAAAVRLGCHWCPLFDPTKIKIVDNPNNA